MSLQRKPAKLSPWQRRDSKPRPSVPSIVISHLKELEVKGGAVSRLVSDWPIGSVLQYLLALLRWFSVAAVGVVTVTGGGGRTERGVYERQVRGREWHR